MSTDSGESRLAGSGDESEYPDFHRSTRMPLDAVVRLHFEGTVAYQNGFAANVSATGMYVKHPDPPPLGTRLVFEFTVGEERKPVQGAGFVAWSREKYEGPGRPAGIGIQFTELDALSRQHIAEALFAFLELQLGDELADSQDAADLLATTSTRTPIDVVDSFGRDAEDKEPSGKIRLSTSAIPVTPAQPFDLERELATEATPPAFKPFGGEAESEAAISGRGLFTPEIPPDDLVLPRSGQAKRAKSPWPAVAVGVGLAAAGFGAWWFLAGPGSLAPATEVVSAPAPEARPTPPPRPALEPVTAPNATLAETVGAAPAARTAPEPLPTGGAEGVAESDDAGTNETGSEPPQPSAAAPAPAAAPIRIEPSPAPAPVAGSAARLTRVTAIEWEESTDLTVVVVSGDGTFPQGSYRWNEIRDANPRVLVRFMGMAAGFGKSLLAAGTPELAKVRIGYHEKPAGNELHVVFDLASPDVKVESVEASGNRLFLRFSRQ